MSFQAVWNKHSRNIKKNRIIMRLERKGHYHEGTGIAGEALQG